MPITPALAAVRKALDKRGIGVPLSAPDVGTTAFDPSKVDFQQLVGAYDLHDYYHDFDWKPGNQGKLAQHVAMMAGWADWAHRQGKPLFLSEYGFFGAADFHVALRDAEMVVRDLAAGVDGFNRWSYLNRGDLDGQWQLLQTWDVAHGKLLDTYTPWPNAYYFVGLTSRFTAKHSAVLAGRVEGGAIGTHQRVFLAPLRSPKGQLTLLVVNDAPQPWEATIDVRGLASAARLHRYEVSQADKDRADLTIESKAEFPVGGASPAFQDKLAPESLTVYSTYLLKPSDAGGG
jgi:hypothetical protein